MTLVEHRMSFFTLMEHGRNNVYPSCSLLSSVKVNGDHWYEERFQLFIQDSVQIMFFLKLVSLVTIHFPCLEATLAFFGIPHKAKKSFLKLMTIISGHLLLYQSSIETQVTQTPCLDHLTEMDFEQKPRMHHSPLLLHWQLQLKYCGIIHNCFICLQVIKTVLNNSRCARRD